MAEAYHISWDEVLERLSDVDHESCRVYGVPKGGMVATAFLEFAIPVTSPEHADYIIDDLVDSGATKAYYEDQWPSIPFYALFEKPDSDPRWYVFPWEADHPGGTDSVHQNVIRILEYVGIDQRAANSNDIPDRIVRLLDEIIKARGSNNGR